MADVKGWVNHAKSLMSTFRMSWILIELYVEVIMESKYVHLKGEINDDDNKTVLGYELCIQNVMNQFFIFGYDLLVSICVDTFWYITSVR